MQVTGGPSAEPGNNAMVNVLLNWLVPRLPAEKQDQLLQAQVSSTGALWGGLMLVLCIYVCSPGRVVCTGRHCSSGLKRS